MGLRYKLIFYMSSDLEEVRKAETKRCRKDFTLTHSSFFALYLKFFCWWTHRHSIRSIFLL